MEKNPRMPKVLAKPVDLLDPLLFLYFFTLHADQLGMTIGGLQVRLNNLVACALLLLFLLRFPKAVLEVDRGLLLGCIGVTFSVLISLIFSHFKSRCLVFLCWWSFTVVMYVLLPYILARHLGFERVLKVYVLSFFAVGALAALQLLLSFAGVQDPFSPQSFAGGRFVRPNAFAYEPSFYALYMTPIVTIVTLLFLLETGHVGWRTLVAAELLFLISTATSALCALLVMFCVVFVATFFPSVKERFPRLRARLFRMASLLTCLFLCLFVLLPDFSKQFFFKFFRSDFWQHASFHERWVGIVNGWLIFKEHPLLGVGLGAFPSRLYEAWLEADQRFFYLNARELLTTALPLKLFEPSNVFTELLASLGVLGLLAFTILFGIYFKRAARLFSAEVFVCCISMITLLVVLQFNQGLMRTYFWVHFSLCFCFSVENKNHVGYSWWPIHFLGNR